MQSLVGRHKTELPTPCLLLYTDVLDRNIRRMADIFAGRKCKLRPHAKTHKLPMIAHKQIEAGAIGITCAKLEDAKLFVDAGIDNVLIANEIVAPDKIREAVGLSRFASLMVCVDDYRNAENISEIALGMGAVMDVLIEVDVGLKRCGTQPGKPTLELLQRISKLKGIRFKGLMGYEGGIFVLDSEEKLKICHARNRALIETVELIRKHGFPVEHVSAGGSNTIDITGVCDGITDVQVGSYCTMDDWNVKYGLDFEQAVTVLATVISRPEKGRAVTDAGVKSISTDHGMPRVIGREGVTLEALNEEHGKLTLSDAAEDLKIGDVIEMVPSHGCTTIPLHGRYIAVEKDLVVGEFAMSTRSAVY